MTEQQPQQPSPDDLWKEFRDVELDFSERLEGRYREIEGYNALILNQIAGIEDSVLSIEGRITDGVLDPLAGPEEMRLKPQMSLLYLQPDRREELYDQGESGDYVTLYADPHVIRGEVPSRTRQLIDDLFASTGATIDKDRSKPGLQVWKGDVAGQPIEFDVHKQPYRVIQGDKEKLVPTLSIYVNRVNRATTNETQEQAGGLTSSPSRPFSKLRRIIIPKRRKF